MIKIKVVKNKKRNKSIVTKFAEIVLPPLSMIVVSSIILVAIILMLSHPELGFKNLGKLNIYIKNRNIIRLNFYPIIILISLLYLLTNRIWLSFFISSSLLISLGILNKFKIQYLNSPLVARDFKFIKELLKELKSYGASLSSSMYGLIIFLLIFIVFLKIFFDYKIINKKLRYVLLCPLVLWGSFIFFNNYIEYNNIEHIESNKDFYISNGFVNSFLKDMGKGIKSVKFKWDDEDGEKVLSNYKTYDINKKFNIITILVDDYDDLRDYKNMKIDSGVYKAYDSMKIGSLRGGLIAEDGKIDTERDYLTGNIKRHRYRWKTNSHVRYFKDNKYRAEYMINNNLDDYDRSIVNKNLGFDSSIYIKNNNFSKWIIDGYEKTNKKNKMYFNFTRINLKNMSLSNEDSYIKNDNLNSRRLDLLNRHLNQMDSFDSELGKLLKYFNNKDSTIIVLMSNGTANLGRNQEIYKSMGISMDTETEEGFLNKYRVPYLVWANDKAKLEFNKSFSRENEDLSPNFLLADIFDYLDLRGSNYIQYINDKKEDYSVNNKYYFKNKDGYISTKEIPDYIRESYIEFKNVEKYNMR